MTQPSDLAPVHVHGDTMKGSSRSLSRFALIGFLVMVAALAWGFAATAIDLTFGYSRLTKNWADVPQIMQSRVPGYSLLPIFAAPAFYGVALLMIYVGGKVRWGEQRWTAAHLLFVVGVTWSSFFLITLQLNYAAFEIDPDGTGSVIAFFTVVVAGWAALITSVILPLHRRRPAIAVTGEASR